MRDLADSVLQDVRFGWRSLLNDRGFTAVAVVTLALGIGANSAIYTLVDGVLLRALPYERAHELVAVPTNHGFMRGEFDMARERLRSVTALAAYQPGVGVTLSGEGEAERLVGALVSANLLSTLGVSPTGGDFQPEHEQAARGAVAIISDGLWRTRYGGERSVIGRTIIIDGVPHRVIGIMPHGFAFPDAETDMWLPATIDAAQRGTYWGLGGMRAIGRLRVGASAESVQTELRELAEQMRLANPYWTPEPGYRSDNIVLPLHDAIVGNTRTMLLVLMGASLLVWLIACANIGNLMLARGLSRERELAVRMALGAGRTRVIRQLLTESVTLSLIGGFAGLWLGWLVLRGIMPQLPANLPRLNEVGIDFRVLSFTLLASLIAALVFGAIPAIRVAGNDFTPSLTGTGRAGNSVRNRRLSSATVVAEVALAVVLVSGAGLLLRSLQNLSRVDTGFIAERVVTARLGLPSALYDQASQRLAFYEQVIERMRSFPGAHYVAVTRQLPFDGELLLTAAAVEYVTTNPNDLPMFEHRAVTPDYFSALNIPLLEGRPFSSTDRTGTLPVAIVDHTTAQRFWPGESPLGKRLGRPWMQEWRVVVGLVGTVRNNQLKGELTPAFYVPLAQDPGTSGVLVVRTSAPFAVVSSSIRAAVNQVDSRVAVSQLLPFEDLVSAAAGRERAAAILVGAFAALAILLGAVGLYGVLSYTVTQRGHELSVRSALGATRRNLLGLILGEGILLSAIGIAIGLPAAGLAGRAMQSLLYGIDAADPANLTLVTLVLLGTCTASALVPALRALRADPADALRG